MGDECHRCASLAEDIRQLCIWEATKVTDPHPPPDQGYVGGTFSPGYWKYIRDFYEYCPINDDTGSNTPHTFGQMCSKRVMANVRDIVPEAIEKCNNLNS